MAMMWIMTIGYLLVLFLFGFILFRNLPKWGHPEDSIRIDPLPDDVDDGKEK